MKKLIVMGILVMGISAFANSTANEGMSVSDNARLSRPLMIELFGDYGNR